MEEEKRGREKRGEGERENMVVEKKGREIRGLGGRGGKGSRGVKEVGRRRRRRKSSRRRARTPCALVINWRRAAGAMYVAPA